MVLQLNSSSYDRLKPIGEGSAIYAYTSLFRSLDPRRRSAIVSRQVPDIIAVQEISPLIQKVFCISAILVIGIVSGLIGALIGGKYAEQFVFNGVRGYEATGQVGFILAALIGLFSSWQLLMKHKS
jgi:hypothetical protein